MMVAGWVLLTVTAAAAPVDRTHEAVCGLMQLYTTERAYFYEKDRYALPEQVGFLPYPCHDGTRPPVSAPASVGGCGFVFTVTEPGATLEALKAEARGVGRDVEGLRFQLDSKGRITHAGTNVLVQPPDCDAWRKQADPLWRYHDVVAVKDCISGPYAADHPCMTALQELAALARAGVGVAQQEYAAHPTARELVPLGTVSDDTRLCGRLATPTQRAEAAKSLERRGGLLEAVLSPECHAEGVRAGVSRLLARFDAVCPGPHCMKLLALARRTEVPGRDALMASRASQVARMLQAEPPATWRQLLHDVVGVTYPNDAGLAGLMDGYWTGLETFKGLPRDPVVLAFLESARAKHPALAYSLDLVGELQGQGPVSARTFRAWVQSVPCGQLHDAHALQLPLARLREIARLHAKCESDAVSVVQRYTATLAPRELMELLRPFSAEQLSWMVNVLGLNVPERAMAMVDWAVDREPRLLGSIHVNAAVLRRLLAPENVKRLGGRDAVLGALLHEKGSWWYGTLGEDARPLLLDEALKSLLTPERLRRLTPLFPSAKDASTALAGALRAPDARVRAAAAAALAEQEEAHLPSEAARACLAEVRTQRHCVHAVVERLGTPPPGPGLVRDEDGEPRGQPEPPPMEWVSYCAFLGNGVRECGGACGGPPPRGEPLARLAASSGEGALLGEPAVLRSCGSSEP